MEFMTLDNAAYCVVFEITANGLKEKMQFVEDPKPVHVTKNFNGTYDLEIPSLMGKEYAITNLSKQKLSKDAWLLKNDGVAAYLYSNCFGRALDKIFEAMGLPASASIIDSLTACLKLAEKAEDFELCKQIQDMIQAVKKGETIKF